MYSSGHTVAHPKAHAGFMSLLATGFKQSEVPQVLVRAGGQLIMKLIGAACLRLVLVLVPRIWGCLSRPCLWLGSAEKVHLCLSLISACLHSSSPECGASQRIVESCKSEYPEIWCVWLLGQVYLEFVYIVMCG